MKTIQQLYLELENDNLHGLNALLVAIACHDFDAVTALARIHLEHARSNELTSGLCRKRYDISQPLHQRLVEQGVL